MAKIISIIIILFTTISCDWSYSGRTGPKNWGNLKEEYKFCKIGYNQSPIDIKHEFSDNKIKFHYKTSEVNKEKEKYVLRINFYGRDYLKVKRRKYYLSRVHFHHPSEHLVESKPYSIEMQAIHKSEDEQFVVLSIFMKIGKKNRAIEELLEFSESNLEDSEFNFSKLINKDDDSFFYDGSFTTPPCKEGVKWYIMETPIEMSKSQMNRLIKSTIFAKSNARPVQGYHPELY